MPRSRTSAMPCWSIAASAASPRIAATSASCSSVWWSGTPESTGIGGLAFQRAGFGWRLLRRVFRFGRQLGVDPLDDAAFEGRGAVALADQFGRHARARELVRIGIVHDDGAIAGKRGQRTLADVPNCARQTQRAVLVRIFQARVDQRRSASTVKLLFEIFFGDAGSRHGQLLSPGRTRSVKFSKLGNWHGVRQATILFLVFLVNGPALRSSPAMHTAQEDRAGFTRDAELVLSGQVAAEPVPH